MAHTFQNRTVAITGSSAGVGRSATHRFGRAGANIGLIARDERALRETKDEVERLEHAAFRRNRGGIPESIDL